MIIIDTSALLSYFRADDPNNAAVSAAIHGDPIRVVSPYVVAELDYLATRRFGVRVELAILDELSSGAYELPLLASPDLVSCAGVITQYADHEIGVADASLVVLADRYGTNRICTLDRRHFSVMRSLDGEPFELLP